MTIEEWLAWRRQGLGASDAPVIMGVSPYKTRYQLWLDKTQRAPDEPGNWATKRGQELEPIARELYEKEFNCEAPPTNVENSAYPIVRASLDGFDFNSQTILEIKCPSQKDHQTAKEGKIPTKYYPQLQHQLLACSAAKRVHYYSFDGNEGICVEVLPDFEYQQKLLLELLKFWQLVETKTPPELEPSDVRNVFCFNLLDQLEQLDELTAKKKELDAQIAKLKESIFSHSDLQAGKVFSVMDQFRISGRRISRLVRD